MTSSPTTTGGFPAGRILFARRLSRTRPEPSLRERSRFGPRLDGWRWKRHLARRSAAPRGRSRQSSR
eukprot:8337979-Pyramimonas_sp.AAC.1